MDAKIIEELKQYRRHNPASDKPYAVFSRIALDYAVSVSEVSRTWDSLMPAKARQPGASEVRPLHRPGSISSDWREASPVGHVLPQPGALTVLPINAPLIQGRIKKGITPGDMAWTVGMKRGDYAALEEGRMNPTEAQAARISAFLEIPVRNLFVVASGEAFGASRIKGLAVLQLLRCRRRMSMQDVNRSPMCQHVRPGLVSSIERGTIKLPLSPMDETGVAELADLFGATKDAILGTLPPEIFEQVAHNTAVLHAAVQKASRNLPQLDLLAPISLPDGGNKQ